MVTHTPSKGGQYQRGEIKWPHGSKCTSAITSVRLQRRTVFSAKAGASDGSLLNQSTVQGRKNTLQGTKVALILVARLALWQIWTSI